MASVCRVLNENPYVTIITMYRWYTVNIIIIMIYIIYSEYKSRFRNEETISFTLRVMVGIIILYDHLHPIGAFAKKAAIDVRIL